VRTTTKEVTVRARRQVKLIAGVAVATLVILGLSYLIQRTTEQQMAGDFNNQQLQLARDAAMRIEDLFAGVLSSLELAVSLAEDDPQPGTLSPHDLRALFESLEKKAPIDAVLLAEANGRIRTIYPSAAGERPSVRQALRRLADTGDEDGPRIVLVPAGNGAIRRHMAVSVPLRNAKTGQGAAVIGVLDLEALLELHINSIRSGQNGYGWLMDGQGMLLHHPRHLEMVNRNVRDQDPTCSQCHASFDLERQMIEGRSGLARLRVGRDTDTLLAYHPIRLGRKGSDLLDLEFAAPWTDRPALPTLRMKARKVGEELSQALGRRSNLEQADVLGSRMASVLAEHPELKAIRIWSVTPQATGSRLALLGQSSREAAPIAKTPPDLTAASAGSIVVAGTGTTGGPGARVILPLPLAMDVWTVAVAAPYSEVRGLVRASTLRIWVFSAGVLVVLVAAGGVVSRLWTERAKAEERARSSEEMLHMHQQMEQSRRLSELGEMVAQVAHEVRNPLLTVSSGLELLRGEVSADSEAAGLITNTWEAIRRLDGVVGDLLNFTRPMALDHVEADLHSVIDSALKGLRDRITKGHIEVVRRYGTLPPITADTLKLSQLFANLFINALEAMPQGGQLTISTQWVAGPGVGSVRVRVEDTGSGIPAKKLPRIFEPFVTTKRHGIGLGLAVVRRIVELHGGRIEASNLPIGGAEFVVELPLTPAPPPSETKVPR
jgi:signal transduction histidine kinase